MGLDADVGWLWRVTEESGADVACHGKDGGHAEQVTRLFDVMGDALAASGLPRHREPRYPDPLVRRPERVRMGMYGSPTYNDLETLVDHVGRYRRAPRRRGELLADHPTRDLEHASMDLVEPAFSHIVHACPVGVITVYVPIAFPRVIAVDPPPGVELRHIGSSQALARECLFLANLYDALPETDPDYDWGMSYPADEGGWRRVTGSHDFDAEIELVRSLLRVARLSVEMGASITFS